MALLRKSPFTQAGFVSLEVTYVTAGITIDSSHADNKTYSPFLA